MTVTREEIAAFADGELTEPRRSEVAEAVAADAALASDVERHRRLKERLSAHFAPILSAPLPERLTAPLGVGEPKVVDFASAKQRRAPPVRWAWVAGPALAASLALAVLLPRGGDAPPGYASGQLAAVLDHQLVAGQANDAPIRVLLSFRNQEGQFCRAFTGSAESGLACRDASGWQLQATDAGGTQEQGQYRMAASSAGEIMAEAQSMAAGSALTAEEERAAREHGWR